MIYHYRWMYALTIYTGYRDFGHMYKSTLAKLINTTRDVGIILTKKYVLWKGNVFSKYV